MIYMHTRRRHNVRFSLRTFELVSARCYLINRAKHCSIITYETLYYRAVTNYRFEIPFRDFFEKIFSLLPKIQVRSVHLRQFKKQFESPFKAKISSTDWTSRLWGRLNEVSSKAWKFRLVSQCCFVFIYQIKSHKFMILVSAFKNWLNNLTND